MLNSVKRAAFLFALLFAGGAFAASFDCSKNLSAQEKVVCDDPALSALDEKLAGVYAFAQDVAGSPASLRQAQRNWIARRRAACEDATCLKASYEKRISELSAYLDGKTRAFGSALHVAVEYPASAAGYCRSNHVTLGEPGGEISIDLAVKERRISGTIEGSIDCGRKIIGPIDVSGELIGHVGFVEFNGGHTEDDGSRALVASTGRGTYWRVVARKPVEGYVPSRQLFMSPRRAKEK
ncbi:MAG TPA: lysozyme inhibitor LprI family protein [Devosiaceae bacterium]|jgi:uncharacterized protein